MLPCSLWLVLPRMLLGFPSLLRVQQGNPGCGGAGAGHLSLFLPVALGECSLLSQGRPGVVTPAYGKDAAGGHGAGRLSGSC